MIDFNEEDHIYTVNGVVVPHVTGILKAEGFIDPTWYDEYSRTRGTYVHKACALWDRGVREFADSDPVVLAYLQGWINFLHETKFHADQIERPLFQMGFAGTSDRVGIFPGAKTKTIIDIKSGKPAPWAQIQTGAYAVLEGQPYDRMVVELTVEGKYRLHHHRDWQDKNIFLAALAIHMWKKNHRR